MIGIILKIQIAANCSVCYVPFFGGTLLFFLFCSYSSGGEDGYVRVHTFDPAYFDFEFET